MKILDVKTMPNGEEEFTIDLTKAEKEEIKKAYGWKRLTEKRIKQWFLETVKNTIEK